MKKSISLLVIFALILSVFALVGCGSEDDNAGEGLTVSVVVSAGFGDKSFNDSAQAGALKLQEDLGVSVKTLECNGESFKQYMMDAAEQSDVVVCVGWELWEIDQVAVEYPDTKFIWVDNVVDGIESLPNVICIPYAQNEGSFLAGYIAAKMSVTGVVGAVGGAQDAVIDDFIVGYKQGAEYANPDVEVVWNYAETYEDPAVGKECAQALHDKGADVIFQIAGNTGIGVFEAAQEGGYYAIGVDQDQKVTAPEFDDVILCSMIKEVGGSIYDVVKKLVEEDVWEGGKAWTCDMATGHISIAYGDENSTQQVSDTIKAEVDDMAQKIVSGEIEVETTRE